MKFPLPKGNTIVSTNITLHTSGLGNWTEAQFINRFKLYSDSTYVSPVIKEGDKQTVMPWTMYSKMTDEDLRAIFTFLKPIKPAKTIFKDNN